MSLDLGEVDLGMSCEAPPPEDDNDAAMTHPYRTDVQALSERLASRFAEQGFEHPVAASIAVTLRGLTGLGLTDFAKRLELAEPELALIEAGEVTFAELPSVLTDRMADAGLSVDL